MLQRSAERRMKRRNFFSALVGGALGLVGMKGKEERVTDRLRRRLEELRAKPPLTDPVIVEEFWSKRGGHATCYEFYGECRIWKVPGHPAMTPAEFVSWVGENV